MDNITHSLVGLALAEAVVAGRDAGKRRGFRDAAYLVSLLGNNLPDFDFCYAWITGGKLGYLLQHRGYTHTFALVVPLALLALAVVALWLRRRRTRLQTADWWWIAALALAGPLVHVSMDYCNSYGVHPFWPLSERWVYGDFLFIVEPLFWASLIPALFFAARTRSARLTLGGLLGLIIVLCWENRLVPWGSALAVTLLGGALALAAWRAAARVRIATALAAACMVAAVFALSGHVARARVRKALGAEFPRAQVADIVLSPMPADPLCWSVIAVGTRRGEYALRRAVVSAAPDWVAPSRCPPWSRRTTAPLRRVQAPSRRGLVWQGAFHARLSELRTLERTNCWARAFLRYARAPYWVKRGGVTVIGDLRYDRSPRLDFADLVLPGAGARCPRAVPPWQPPRAALLAWPGES